MIHLQYLLLENFMNIELLELEFESNQVVIIHGDNGSGKTAMMSAIALALLGYRKGDSYRDFIKSGQESSHIILDILYRGEPLHFDIVINNNKNNTPLTRKLIFRGTTYVNSECSAFLESLDIEYLEHVMFLFQKDNSIVDLKSGERAKLFKKLFHFEFEEQVAELKARLADETQKQVEATIRLEEASKRTFEMSPLLPEINVEQELIRIAELDAIIAKASSFDENALAQVDEALRREKLKLSRYEAAAKQYKNDIDAKCKALEDFKKLTEPISVNMDSENLHAKLKKEEELYRELILKKKLLQSEYVQAKSQLDVSRTGICHACGNEIDEAHVRNLENKVEELAQRFTEIEIEEKSYVDSIASLTQSYTTAKNLEEKALEERRQYEYKKASLSDYATIIEQSKKLLDDVTLEIEACIKEIQRLEGEKENNSNAYRIIEQAAAAKIERELLQRKVDDANRIAIINSERKRQNQLLQEEAKKHDKELKALAASISETTTGIATLKKALEIFETDFPNFIILRTCSHVENYINDFVAKIFPYMRVKLSQNRGGIDFYYTITDDDEAGWLSVKMASGAQAAILSLAWRIAIAKLYGVTTLLLDEVDAEATDENSKYIYEFISTLTAFDQIILISHRKEALRTVAALADNVMCFEVDNGVYTRVADPEFLD